VIKLRHNVLFCLLRPAFRLYLKNAYHYHAQPAPDLPPGQPVLILANHNCAMDPFMLSISFRRPIFFVASDHIFRLGIVSSIIRFLVAPIPIVKSQIDLRTIRTIMSVMKDGGAVCLFPEGNRSFNGRTGWFPPSTGKLVRQLKSTVLIYRYEGGYMSFPRWALYKRKGLMQGRVVRQIEPDQLAEMTPEAINEIIRQDLSLDAFAEQRSDRRVRYHGKRLAEALERALFVCPKCGRLATLHSCEDRFFCSCGLAVRYDEFGFFQPDDPWTAQQQRDGAFLDTVAAWDDWQKQALIAMLDEPEKIDLTGNQPIFTDEGETLFNCVRARRSIKLGEGRLMLFADRLSFVIQQGLKEFPLQQISRVIVHGPQTLQFTTTESQVFEFRSKSKRSAYKYVLLFNLLQQKRKGEPHGFFGI